MATLVNRGGKRFEGRGANVARSLCDRWRCYQMCPVQLGNASKRLPILEARDALVDIHAAVCRSVSWLNSFASRTLARELEREACGLHMRGS